MFNLCGLSTCTVQNLHPRNINYGNRTEWSQFVGSNLFCNHTSVQQNGTTALWESDLFNHECDYGPNWSEKMHSFL